MAFAAIENFRAGGVRYGIGDPVPDHIAAQHSAWCSGSGALGVDEVVLVEKPASDDDAITLMLGEVVKLEGLDVVPISKAQISQILLGHYLEAGLLEMPQPAPDLAKPVPVIFQDPIVDPVNPDAVAGEAGGKPTPEIFADPIVDAVLPELDLKMTLKTLVAIADSEGVKLTEAHSGTKADYIAAIAAKRAADNPGPRTEELE